MSNAHLKRRLHVAVIVLGDVGRSPRMQYHTRSLLEGGNFVSIVGYSGEDLIPDLNRYKVKNDNEAPKANVINEPTDQDQYEELLKIVRFEPFSPPVWLKKYKFASKVPIGLPVYLVMRVTGILFSLVYALWFRVPKRNNKKLPVDCIVVQNPPSIPLLLLTYIYCMTNYRRTSINGKKEYSRPAFIIDWHNLGFSMFETSPNHPIKKIAKYYERKLGPLSDGNLCVTSSMKEYLISTFHIQNDRINVLYDRPPEFFHLTPLGIKHQLMMKLRDEMELSCPDLKKIRLDLTIDGQETTLFTKRVGSDDNTQIQAQPNQPILLISSTSWTPDEDFSILLNALVDLNSKLIEEEKNAKSLSSHFVVIVTGKGPQKEMYQSKISQMNLKHVSIITMWLEAKDYPLLLGCADLGISLHISTSGYDLPMKIYDFFGCEVPVCAIGFSCLDELVKDNTNGRIFQSSAELSSQMFQLCFGRKREENNKLDGDLKGFRHNIRGITRWRENWIENASETILKGRARAHKKQYPEFDSDLKSIKKE
jgi:beta-1,4-mannosyltransferase